eukprot:2185082-Rhodomonas_salina.1
MGGGGSRRVKAAVEALRQSEVQCQAECPAGTGAYASWAPIVACWSLSLRTRCHTLRNVRS